MSYQEYLSYFEEVYTTMSENYFDSVTRENFDKFLVKFDEKIYPNLVNEGKSNDFVRWRSAAFLVEDLKRLDDPFTQFYPPPTVEEYEQQVYGKKIDLGIEGKLVEQGFHVKHVEPRSDAYSKGLRENDLVLQIADKNVKTLTQKEIEDLLVPFEGDMVGINYIANIGLVPRSIQVVSKEYFKQTVFMIPTGVKGIYCLEIQKFNRKTGEDMMRFLQYVKSLEPKGLILDLRGNPGGPPLAAREISSFFMEPGTDLTYFEGIHKEKASLDVPVIPDEFHYRGPIVILVNEKSGSASEMFTFTMQDRDRALVMGKNTAGLVYLKSLFHLSDESMIAMMTALAHFPDGRPFSLSGVTPNEYIPDEKMDDLVNMAAKYLYVQSLKESGREL